MRHHIMLLFLSTVPWDNKNNAPSNTSIPMAVNRMKASLLRRTLQMSLLSVGF